MWGKKKGGSGGPTGRAAGRGARWSARCGSAGEGTKGGPVGVGHGGAVAVGQPKGIVTFCFIQSHFNGTDMIRSEDGLPELKKFQIKYGCEWIKIRNNFPYCNFSKFGIEFELKFREGSRCLNLNEI
jgi:hypothetical protein